MVSRPTQSPGQIPPQNRTCRTTASGSRQTPVVTPIQQELNLECVFPREGYLSMVRLGFRFCHVNRRRPP
ncbi:hypothetical protein, partial [Xenorhabdus sp. SGI246]|uniref:hypothetical protein n=1 Tax=Xenorhabdus sp. SGI246 TaxID=3158263 RepID=UPI00349F1BA5